jgi:hypothetical protein
MLILGFILLFIIGRLLSLFVYQICWTNGASGKFLHAGATATCLTKPLPWILHLVVVCALAQLSWDQFPILQKFAVLCAILLTVGSVGRFGNADLGRCFWFDRLLIIVFAAGVVISPVCLYLCLISACCLQYTVASWKLSPGYSNLLGFEWIRATTCMLTASLAVFGGMKSFGISWGNHQALALAVVLGFQASSYVNQALAKSALGKHPFSWILENRLHCLVANAWLRGWQIHFTKATVLRIAQCVRHWRIAICASAWLIEFCWLFLFIDHSIASVVIAATIVLHLVIFILTGLASYHYIASHCFILGILLCIGSVGIFIDEHSIGAAVVIVAYALWLSWFRPRLLKAYQETGKVPVLSRFADPADHLMAWWDSPYMRMFCYTVETRSGETYFLPTPKLSPHDTAITDIHTHLMILGLHQDLDPAVESDRAIVRSGVWGLLIDTADRNKLYEMMDAKHDPSCLKTDAAIEPWEMKCGDSSPASAVPLRNLFESIQHGWFKRLSCWPHFPGEDFALDWCPLADLPAQAFDFKQPISKVTIWRIKTWFTGEEMKLLESSRVGIIHLNDISNPA